MSIDEDFESVDFAENIEPNDFAPRDLAENIDLIDRPDSDLNEANEIVSAMLSRLRFWRGEAIIRGSACGNSGPIDFRAFQCFLSVLRIWSFRKLNTILYEAFYLHARKFASSLDKLQLGKSEQNQFRSVSGELTWHLYQ